MTPGRPALTDPTRTTSSPGIDTYSRDKQNLFGWEGNYSEQFTSKFQQVTTGSVSTNDYYFRSPYGDSYSNNLRGVLNTRSEVAVSNKDFFVAGFEYNREQVEDTYISDYQRRALCASPHQLGFLRGKSLEPHAPSLPHHGVPRG